MVRIIKVSGINGLSRTGGVREGADLVVEKLKKEGVGVDESLVLDSGDLSEQDELIYEKAKKEFSEGERVVFIGGDHSISYSLTRAFFDKFEEGCLVVFDAHVDGMPALDEPTHEEWLRGVVERKKLFGGQVLLVGVRKIEDEEKKFLMEKGIEILNVEGEDLFEKIREFIGGRQGYLSFDVDVFDPNFFDSSGFLEEGGFGEELFSLLEKLGCMEEIKGIDVVEFHGDKGDVERSLVVVDMVVKSFL